MKHGRLLIVMLMLILCSMLSFASVSATDLTNETIGNLQDNPVIDDNNLIIGENNNPIISEENNGNSLYVSVKGSSYADATSWSSATNSLDWAMFLAKDNTTIYIDNGTYKGSDNSKIKIDKSVNIVGSTNTVFDGLNKNYFFTISDGVTVSISNITFINAFKKLDYLQDKKSIYGAVLDVKKATVFINNCTFNNNRMGHIESTGKSNYGGTISNLGNMTIINSRFSGNSMTSDAPNYAHGSDVYNNGSLKIFDSTFKGSHIGDFGFGGSISNDGNLTLTRVVMSDSRTDQQVKGAVLYNSGNCTMVNSTIKDSFVTRALFNTLFGVVYNEGNLKAIGCIFTNNGGVKDSSIPVYKGTVNIYNVGEIDISYSAFLNNKALPESYSDFFADGGKNIYLDNNWWGSNEKPVNKSNVNKVESWLMLVGSPEYSALDINGSTDISAIWKSSSGKPININLFPIFDVSFNTWVNGTPQTITKTLFDGSATINYNWTQKKGSYDVSISLGDFTQKVLVDVGKLVSNMTVSVNDIYYTENLVVNVTVSGIGSLLPGGNVSIIIGGKTYTERLVNGKATFNIPNLLAGNHTLNIAYMGDNEYFRAFAYKNITVNKCPIYLNLSIPEIKVGEIAKMNIHASPKEIQIMAYLSINGKRVQMIVINKENTSVTIKNYGGAGVYNITVETWGGELDEQLYEMTSASALLKVNKYETNLTVNASDVKVGENVTITIKISPEDVRGEAILVINGVESKIFLKDEITNVTLHDLAGGKYNVTVIYPGDNKYANSTASTSFFVLKESCNLTVDVVQNDNLTGIVNIKTNPKNCTGLIGVYVNNVFYQAKLVNGIANISVNFTKGTNYIYVYYPGNDYYDEASWNTTINITDKCILTGEDIIMVEGDGSKYTVKVTDLEGNPFTYVVVVMEVNGEKYNVITNNVGKASLPLNLTSGNYTISATYDYTKIYNNITVKPLDFNLTVDNIEYGENAVIKANFNALINGTITFIIKNHLNKTVEVISGNASYSFGGLKLGTYTVEAIYDSKLSKTTSFTVSKTTPNLNVDIKDVLAGQDEVITLTLPNDATGEVTFIVDGIKYIKTLNNGIATVTISDLSLGNHSLKVIYSGDNNYNNNTADITFSIKNSLSKTVIEVNNTVYGENITVMASVTSGATGNVTFIIGNLTKTVEIINGKAVAVFDKLNAGTYSVKADYLGNSVYSKSSDEKSFNINKASSHIEIVTSEILFDKNIRIWAVVNDDATGNVTFRILGLYSPRNKTIVGGNASWYISPLDSGSYVVVATYNGDNNYLSSNTSKVISLNQTTSILKVTVEVGEDDIVFSATLKTEDGQLITGNVTLEVNNEFYKIVVVNGTGMRSIDKLPDGKYTYSATYKGTDKISRAIDSGVFEVKAVEYNVILNAPDVKMIYHDGTRFIATLTDKQGNPIRDAAIEITINGKTYTKTTDEKGVVSLGLSLDSGIYTVTVNFKGTADYTPITKQAKVTIEPTVKGLDVVKMFRNDTQYYAIFTDSQGNPLKNKDVQFNINGVFYTKTTNDKGIAMMGINLNPGKYVITAINLVTGEQSGNNITVKSLIVQNDLTKYYLNASRFQTTIYNKDGSLAANKEVTFNINGVFYHKKTDENGIASLGISLRPGEYIITTMVDGLSIGNKVNVLPTLITKNLNMKYLDGSSFTAQTLDGQGKPIANQNVSFNVNGVFYHKLTDNNGIAKLGIRLMAGEYIITSYWNDFQTGNTIKIS